MSGEAGERRAEKGHSLRQAAPDPPAPPPRLPSMLVYVVQLKLEDERGREGKLVAPLPLPTPRTLSVVYVPESANIYRSAMCG